MTRHGITFVVLSALAGVFVALLSATVGQGYQGYFGFDWGPPADYNTCGWHSACTDPPYGPTSGNGLDFSGGTGGQAQIEVWAIADDYLGPFPVTAIWYINSAWGNCEAVRAETHEWLSGDFLQDMYFVHADGNQIHFPYVEYWGGPHIREMGGGTTITPVSRSHQ